MSTRNLINSRWLAICCIVFIILVLGACSGGPGSDRPALPEPPPGDDCDLASIPASGGCQPFAVRLDERIPTPFVEDGVPVSLEAVLVQPPGGSRFPTVIVHHGSTGNGSDPASFGITFTSKPVVRYFVERGWQVVFPQRRGRGQSDGLYDEGFTPDRSGYSCIAARSLAGAERALDDLDVITDWVRQRADVDTTLMLVTGSSRGGVLALAHAARRPDVFSGAVNFVGGWIGEGCGDHLQINHSLFTAAAAWPLRTLWLYGANDTFYSLPYTRALHETYMQAGGLGDFRELVRSPGLNGHFIINDRELWAPSMDEYLAQFR